MPIIKLSLFGAARLLAVFAIAGAGLGVGPRAAAQDCSFSQPGYIVFGTTSQRSNTDTTSDLRYSCSSPTRTVYYRVCLYVSEAGAPLAGVNPRLMSSAGGGRLKFDLYYDAARTQIIGSSPASGYPAAGDAFVVPARSQSLQRSIRIYGRVPPNQDMPAGPYTANHANSAVYWAWSTTSTPASCLGSAEGTGSRAALQILTTAEVSNRCRIAAVADMDFGGADSLSKALASSARISIRCPFFAPWKVGLDNGMHASGGVRRMKNATGQYVPYALYRNPTFLLPFGDIASGNVWSGTGAGEFGGSSIVTVYGQVPLPPAGQRMLPPGDYRDTVKITLSF